AHLLPEVGALDYGDHDPHSQRILDANDWRNYEISEDHIRRARRGYFANISYIDDLIGGLLETLEATRQEATIVFCADHGDMLGERGLWFKMSFLEGSARVPLMIAGDGFEPGVVETPASMLDIAPTLAEIGGVGAAAGPWSEGRSLMPLAAGAARDAPVMMEYAAEASIAPLVGLRDEQFKYIRCGVDPEQLFNLEVDPGEQVNLAQDPAYGLILETMRKAAEARWDLDALDADVRASQARRLVVYEALRKGVYAPWDYQPRVDASDRFMRNHHDLNVLEENQRFPRGE
ncbi:MAG: sulfatase-like hydrolase/transferase, partial [Pseudomonadota bacterium]